MMLIRDRKIYARLDALFERMPEDIKQGLGFNENGKRAKYGEYYFHEKMRRVNVQCAMCIRRQF